MFSYPFLHLQGGGTYVIFVVKYFQIFGIIILCFVVAICDDLVYVVETMQLFLKYE